MKLKKFWPGGGGGRPSPLLTLSTCMIDPMHPEGCTNSSGEVSVLHQEGKGEGKLPLIGQEFKMAD